MFERIVLAHDGSEGAQRALTFAADLARRDNSQLILAHVTEPPPGGRKTPGPIQVDEDQIRADLEHKAEELSAQGLETSVELAPEIMGGPAHAITSIADQVDADLIVCGTRGHSPVSGLLLGSVTQRLLHLSRRPILVVPPAA